MTVIAEAESAAHVMPFGTALDGDHVVFRLWAPRSDVVLVDLEGSLAAMHAREEGWHEARVRCPPGTRYRYVLPNGMRVPDPASRFQPEDVLGPSEVIDPAAFRWTALEWKGRPWPDAVIYELHVGAFTAEGTFKAAAEKLPHLVELGVTAIQIMPVADFGGSRNWGYDGVLLFAPDSSYGRPDDMKAFVDEAHRHGLMVLLDVVYNHFGPEGNFLPLYAPAFTERHKTPWGPALNFDDRDSRWMREFVIHNALYWLREFRLDGLRLDAVHAIVDSSPLHLLDDLAARVREACPGREVHLILENEENEATRVAREGGAPVAYTAQWNDDVHHVLHTAVTGESQGYYADYIGRTDLLGRALAEGFAFQGEHMPYRGSARGEPSFLLPPTAFVSFLQNHDQVGNRAFGDRITASAPPEAVRAAACVYLLAPQIPMLFMGEEWAARQPFPFFVGFEGGLSVAVREGRRAEFARFPEFRDEATREHIPDPSAPETFLSAKLVWSDLNQSPHRDWLDWYRSVLGVRRTQIVPRLAADPRRSGTFHVHGQGAVTVAWSLGDGSDLTLQCNLSAARVTSLPPVAGRPIWRQGDATHEGTLGPWAVRWTLNSDGATTGTFARRRD